MGLDSTKRQLVASYLLINANDEKGVTASELLDSLPQISRPTLYRILTEPGFKETTFSRFPKQYWYDPAIATQAARDKAKANGNGKVKQVTDYPDRTPHTFANNMLRATIAMATDINGAKRLAAIANQAHQFAKDGQTLEYERKYFEELVDDILSFFNSGTHYINQLKNHPKYGTTEWWRVFEDE